MTDQRIVRWITDKFQGLSDELAERAHRRWAAVEAVSLGYGGIAVVGAATGMAHSTIRRGIRELNANSVLAGGRQRRVGAGRKRKEVTHPGIKAALEGLVEPESRGDPQSPLRWTCKTTRRLAEELTARGYPVGATTVRHLLKEAGYSLQANRKTGEGASHPDRDAQFRYINRRVRSQQRSEQPAVSVDAKKKETLGNLKNPGARGGPKASRGRLIPMTFPTLAKARRCLMASTTCGTMKRGSASA